MKEVTKDNMPLYEFLIHLVELHLNSQGFSFERSPDPEFDYLLSIDKFHRHSKFVDARLLLLDAPANEIYPYVIQVASHLPDDCFLILVCRENNSPDFTVKVREKQFYTTLQNLI